MILKSLFRVVLPQLLVRWLPVAAVLTVGLEVALAVGRALGVGLTVGVFALVLVFYLCMEVAEALGGIFMERLIKRRRPMR
jgi:hypothetical protein